MLGPAYPSRPLRTLAAQANARWWFDHYSRKHRPGHRFTFVDCLTGNLGIDRELFDSVGGLDPEFGVHRREDWELGVRLLEGGAPFTAAPEAVAFHHHAPTVLRLVRDARREGYGDVLLATRHPIVVADLRLERFTDGRLAGRRWPLQVTVGRAATNQPTSAAVRALDALERSNLRHGWSRAFGRLWTAAYYAGVQAALDDGHRIPRGARARTLVDVDSDAPIEFQSALGEITLVLGGQEIGHVLAPHGQWDEDEIVERAIDVLGLPALAAEARRAGR